MIAAFPYVRHYASMEIVLDQTTAHVILGGKGLSALKEFANPVFMEFALHQKFANVFMVTLVLIAIPLFHIQIVFMGKTFLFH